MTDARAKKAWPELAEFGLGQSRSGTAGQVPAAAIAAAITISFMRRERTPPPRQSLQPIMYLRNAGHRELLLAGLDKAYRSDSVSVLTPSPAVAFD